MQEKIKVRILDKVCLDVSAMDGSLLQFAGLYDYYCPADVPKNLGEFILQNPQSYFLVLVDPLTLHREQLKVPIAGQKRLAFAVVASPHELNDVEHCEDLLASKCVIDVLESPLTANRLNILLRRAELYFQQERDLRTLKHELTQQRDELHKLNEIGIALSSERDISKLLDIILSKSMEITDADAGSLYIVEEIEGVEENPAHYLFNKQLRFRHTKNYSKAVPFKEFTMPISPNSIAGYVALSGKPLNLPDVYEISGGVPYGFGGRNFDQSIGYRTTSMLVVPMLNRSEETIGVIQLINKKRDVTAVLTDEAVTKQLVIAFNKVDEDFIYSLASQAAVAYENKILFEAHKNLLDSFIRLIADAIDKKSPYTGGHCNRVPVLTEMLTRAACDDSDSVFADFNLTPEQWYELHIAAWLHDCGKVTTPVHVMDKSTKLETIYDRIETVKARFEVLKRDAKIDYLKAQLAGDAPAEELKKTFDKKIAKLEDDLRFIESVNVGGEYLENEKIERIRKIAFTPIVLAGQQTALLSGEETYNLSIRKGTLTPEERQIINDHISVTIAMLEKLPFPRNLMRVPEYAGGHHEKMDGTGYPKGLKRSEMSIPSRIMAIADVFEALTAVDRPYKKGKSLSEAMRIMGCMKKENHLDPDLFDLFVKSKVYRAYAEKYMSPELIDEVDEEKLLAIKPNALELKPVAVKL
ncbi:putative metal dependent phosphohydrolase [Chloroherpeton thalassium ATCC 35110]|uniref:Putative metal dependent phosphohydrolase n=1 Tax=Chloroherpeton thalassium (strain ATCC 35110 / GB-78) TaxID=517418 RepID=B3QTC9_CHLT3|nr:HD family phosphohydrolase [Chloroherpeton thalassium]ACF14228.1 putative metal dependent phosphohydrolase [Chloroherpeton thalassium ATCC 35110]